MAKFQIGDCVKILDGSQIKDYMCGWNMSDHVGEIRKVKSILTDPFDNRTGYGLEGLACYYDERGLELVSSTLADSCEPPVLKFKNGSTITINIDPVQAEFDNERFSKFLDEYCAIGCRTFMSDGTLIKNGAENMNLKFETHETSRIDKTCNKQIPTLTTVVSLSNQRYDGTAVCDKEDYDERQGVLEAIANMVCGGNFDKAYNKAKSAKKKAYAQQCKCESCGKSYDTPEQARDCEKAHVERKKAKHEKYLMMKAAKKLAREMQIEQIAKELLREKR